MEIRPLIDQENFHKIISFSFPETSLNFYNSDKTDYLLQYIDASFGAFYKEINGQIVLEKSDFDQFGTIESFELIGEDEFEVHLILYKDYYNFEYDA
ncbi:hypothetical protein [Zunongwangia pacifica]|uniref:Uncharacterized protein n=1 Tax=Zunongwangia pacifica TaxID=2911062 RepID=A0A9X1ZTH9_9FLAO|nr:hypothetical protein [Zunongwangia pacifica]MCL6220732.1 hypothetical protein [Zunongwangia pacifica]